MSISFTENQIDLSVLPELRRLWRERYNALPVELQHRVVAPIRLCRLEADPSCLEGYRAVPCGDADSLPTREWRRGESFILDFGEHHVGFFRLAMRTAGQICDSPVSLRLLAGEMPYELAFRHEEYHGRLSEAWVQEERFKFDELPLEVTLPRRYTARYLLVEVAATPSLLIFDRIDFDTVSAENRLVPPPPQLTEPLDRDIFTVGCRTLRDCMQKLLEDGPKRDRRLWLGDLYLEAKANSVTFRNTRVIERCMYLLASTARPDGSVAACAFDNPGISPESFIPDYTLLFTPLLLDFLRTGGNPETVRDLYPLACQQFTCFRRYLAEDIRLHADPTVWFFIDHGGVLATDTAEYGVYLYALRHLQDLAETLGRTDDAEACRREQGFWRPLVRKQTLDGNGVLLSGDSRQLSVASQIWGVLGGILTPEEGLKALAATIGNPDAVQVFTPFLMHFLLEAYVACGRRDLAIQTIREYWGGMLKRGAETFWEAFTLSGENMNIYEDMALLSFCHAWSCTPCLFLAEKE